jgi:hypothetical protein
MEGTRNGTDGRSTAPNGIRVGLASPALAGSERRRTRASVGSPAVPLPGSRGITIILDAAAGPPPTSRAEAPPPAAGAAAPVEQVEDSAGRPTRREEGLDGRVRGPVGAGPGEGPGKDDDRPDDHGAQVDDARAARPALLSTAMHVTSKPPGEGVAVRRNGAAGPVASGGNVLASAMTRMCQVVLGR